MDILKFDVIKQKYRFDSFSYMLHKLYSIQFHHFQKYIINMRIYVIAQYI